MARRRKFTVEKTTPAGMWMKSQSKKLAKKPRVKIGITQRDFNDPKEGEPSEFTVGEVAVVNEFGTADGRIPERSFIRSTTDEERRRVEGMLKRLKITVLVGFMKTEVALGLIGAFMKGKIQNKIVTLRTPPNKPSTIRQKTRDGNVGDNPLINFGQMRQKIDWVVQDGPDR